MNEVFMWALLYLDLLGSDDNCHWLGMIQEMR